MIKYLFMFAFYLSSLHAQILDLNPPQYDSEAWSSISDENYDEISSEFIPVGTVFTLNKDIISDAHCKNGTYGDNFKKNSLRMLYFSGGEIECGVPFFPRFCKVSFDREAKAGSHWTLVANEVLNGRSANYANGRLHLKNKDGKSMFISCKRGTFDFRVKPISISSLAYNLGDTFSFGVANPRYEPSKPVRFNGVLNDDRYNVTKESPTNSVTPDQNSNATPQ